MAASAEVQARASQDQVKGLREQVGLSAEEVRLAQRSIEGSIQPLLVDVPERLYFDERRSHPVRFRNGTVVEIQDLGALILTAVGDEVLLSIALRNVGAGVAVISGLGLSINENARVGGDMTRAVLPTGELARFSFTFPRVQPEYADGIAELKGGRGQIEVGYTDGAGGQSTVTRCFLAGDPLRIRQVGLLHAGDDDPFAMSGPADA
jgi:hypothetical protein